MIDRLKAALSIPVYNDDDGFCWCAVEAEEIRETIQRLEQVEVLREALMYYAKEHKNPSDGPWGRYSDDHGDVARNALNQAKLP